MKWEKVLEVGGATMLSTLQGEKHLWFTFVGGPGGRSGFGFFDGQKWRQALTAVTGKVGTGGTGGTGVMIFAGPKWLNVVRREALEDLQQITLPPGIKEARNFLLDPTGRLWLRAHDDAGDVTYCYHPDGNAPAVAIVESDLEVRQNGRLRAQVVAVEKFQSRQKKTGYGFSSRIDGRSWSAFHGTPEVSLDLRGLSPGLHRLAVRSRDEAGEISPVPAEVNFTILAPPLEQRAWFRPAALTTFATIVLLTLVAFRQAAKSQIANRHLQAEVGEKIQAQNALQKAHDELERRVEERSAQLEEQITVRQKAEGQFAATLAERNRLGREIHDTLEQTLASVGFQLSAAKLALQNPERVAQHLDTATNVLRQSRVEVRRSVLDLRSQTLENFDLAMAFTVAAKQLTDGSGGAVQVRTSGEPRRFPPRMENSILRIGQEALTNASKHAQATQLTVELEFHLERFCLRIRDNGRGFDPGNQLMPDEGHFGLLGMRERAERLGGQLHLTSDSLGTSVAVEVPLANLSQPPA